MINNTIWQIKPVTGADKGLIRDDGTTTIGMTNNNTKTIYINNNIYGELLYKVLCHEIVHAFMFSYNFYLDEHQEEMLANFIAEYGKEIVNNTDSIIRELCYGYEMC